MTRSSIPTALPRPGSSRQWGVLATAMTTPRPRRSTVFIRQKLSNAEVHGDHLKPWNMPRSNGRTGSTIDASSRPSVISRQPKPRSDNAPCWTTRPWQHNLSRKTSGNPGAVHGQKLSRVQEHNYRLLVEPAWLHIVRHLASDSTKKPSHFKRELKLFH